MRKKQQSQQGFTLVEIMITLALGLIISGAVIRIMVSNTVTENLNRAVTSAQENGRFLINRMRSELLMVGLYDDLSPNIEQSVDTVEESNFVRNHPVISLGEFPAFADIGSTQGESGGNDTLTVSLLAQRDCRGYKLGYVAEQEFYVVNEYYVDGTTLKCRGFDGRVLRGQRIAVGHNSHAGFSLVDDVISFQVSYGVSKSSVNGDNFARPTQFVTADQLGGMLTTGNYVVALRIAVVVKGDGKVNLSSIPSFKLLNEAAFTPDQMGLYKSFETTITLRNMKNFVRSAT